MLIFLGTPVFQRFIIKFLVHNAKSQAIFLRINLFKIYL